LPSNKEKHYLRVSFALEKDKTPEIYDFLFEYLPKVLKSLKVKTVSLEIERLESLNSIFTNLDYNTKEIRKIFSDFVKSHHLHKKASLTAERDKTSVTAKVSVAKLAPLLDDYNQLFDIFFTDLTVKGKGLSVEMMDAFNNSVLVAGDKKSLEKFRKELKKLARRASFSNADHLALS
jgi:hypothetical protein